jgi:hypothetical protein
MQMIDTQVALSPYKQPDEKVKSILPPSAPCSYLGAWTKPSVTAYDHFETLSLVDQYAPPEQKRVSMKVSSIFCLPHHVILESHLSRQKLRRQRILARNRLHIAFEKWTPAKKKDPPLWRRCENTIWHLTFTKIKICSLGYLDARSQLFLDAARSTLFSLPYEKHNEELFFKEFIKIKGRFMDTLDEIGKTGPQNMQTT